MMQWLTKWTIIVWLVLVTAVGNVAAAAPRSPIYSYVLPSWQATVADRPSIVRVRENDLGFTQIDFRWPVRLNNVNSRLQEQVWEDGESYVVFNKSGNRIFCSCEGDASYDVAFKRTNKSDIYYFVDRDYVSAPLKYNDVTYRYTFFSLSGKGAHYYQCVFAARLGLIASPALLRKTLPAGGVSEITSRIATFLSTHGADLARDKCDEIDFKK